MRHGTEPEMMWLKKDENGKPNGGYSNPYCYHIDQFESLRPVYMRVIEYGRKMGLDMIQGDHEDAPGQLELNFNYDDALRTADRLDHLPPDLRAGGARVQHHRLLHVQAVHGRLGQWLPPQHLAVEGRQGRVEAARQRPEASCRASSTTTCTAAAATNTFMPDGDDSRCRARSGSM